MTDFHLHATDDVFAHEMSEDCPCGPAPVLREHGGWLYVHNALIIEDVDVSS